MSCHAIEIIRREDNRFVEAELYDELQPEDLLLVERAWGLARIDIHKRLLGMSIQRSDWPESLHWDWSKKATELKLIQATGFGIVCSDSWEGVMLTKTATCFAQLAKDKGKPLVYIDYLEIAPWNWCIQPLGHEGRYKGIGSMLFREAIKQSIGEGFHGRVGLHALPQAIEFYEKTCGMTALGRDPQKQNLMYFEMSRDGAEQFLDTGGAS